MKINFTPYEQALTLKELGFDEMCVGYYQIFEGNVINFDTISTEVCERLCKKDNFIKAPLYQQAFRWFREKYGLFGWIEGNEGKRIYMYRIESPIDSDDQLNCFPFKTYEEAELACLRKLIEIVNQNKDE